MRKILFIRAACVIKISLLTVLLESSLFFKYLNELNLESLFRGGGGKLQVPQLDFVLSVLSYIKRGTEGQACVV